MFSTIYTKRINIHIVYASYISDKLKYTMCEVFMFILFPKQIWWNFILLSLILQKNSLILPNNSLILQNNSLI